MQNYSAYSSWWSGSHRGTHCVLLLDPIPAAEPVMGRIIPNYNWHLVTFASIFSFTVNFEHLLSPHHQDERSNPLSASSKTVSFPLQNACADAGVTEKHSSGGKIHLRRGGGTGNLPLRSFGCYFCQASLTSVSVGLKPDVNKL